MSLIRTHTFLKYARINLQEAEAALAEGQAERCASKVSDVYTALIKAVAAALPTVKADFFNMTDRQLLGHISDLAQEEECAKEIVELLSKARQACQAEPLGPGEAGAALSAAGQAFSQLHDLFL